jgi:hypothetical protein
MKKISLLFGFLTIFLLGIPEKSRAQYIIAGEHSAANYFVDIIPDTTLTGPYNHPPGTLPPVVFPIDINGDSINEFSMSA